MVATARSLPAGVKPSGTVTVVSVAATKETKGEPCAIVVRPSSFPSAPRLSMTTTDGSLLETTELAAPSPTVTSATNPPAIVFSPAVTRGMPNANPSPVSPKPSGRGKTGLGTFPKTSPEYHLFVGGVRPSANRATGSSLGVRCGIPATRGATSARTFVSTGLTGLPLSGVTPVPHPTRSRASTGGMSHFTRDRSSRGCR